MKINPFGKTTLQVSEIGFGGSRIGGVFAGKAGRQEALAVLGKSLDAGINFYDTADMYAQGESESLIGTAFRGRRDQVIIATKGGYCLPARRNLVRRIKPLLRPIVQALGIKRARLPIGASGALSQDFSPAYLTRALEASLKRLRTDHVDLYQLHSPGASFMRSAAFGESLLTLDKLRSEGKLRFYGIGTESLEEVALGLTFPGVSSVQLGFGLLDLEALDQGVLAAATEKGVAVIARGCFGGGLLKEDLKAEDLQAMTPKWQRILALRAAAQDMGRPVLDLALQFCRGTPGVSTTLLGMHAERHLRGNLAFLNSPALDSNQYEALRLKT